MTARNEYGAVTCHCNLIVDKGIRSYIAPEFISPLVNEFRLYEGEEICLSAHVEAYPAISITWHKDNLKLRSDRRMNVSIGENGYAQLSIFNATISDSGVYKCIASNAIGRCECSFTVQVEDDLQRCNTNLPQIKLDSTYSSGVPLFIKRPRIHESSEILIIDCHVAGDPDPEVVLCKGLPSVSRISDADSFNLD